MRPGYGASKRRENDKFLFCWIYSILTIWILRTLQYVITIFLWKFCHPTSTLGKEKYLFSISDRFRSWGAEIFRNRYIFYLVIFVIWVGLSIIRPKKIIVITEIILLTVTLRGCTIYTYMYLYIFTRFSHRVLKPFQ